MYFKDVVVGLEKIDSSVQEDANIVNLCATVVVRGDCTIAFSFNLSLSTTDDSASNIH